MTTPKRGSSLEDFHMRLMRAFHAQRTYLRPRVDGLGLGPGQPKMLVYLAVHGPSSQREVADFFECDPGAVSRMFDSLERAGFVTSAPGRDRRTKMLALTERGQAASDAWDAICAQEEGVMLAGFSQEERAAFAGLLARVRANLWRAIDGTDSASGPEGGEA
ncbi:MarR family winged helix-turn-helix transcriptional regulator [Olsenella uli]|uniref:MarR family winged helix-turn-helix transcriptional regulator n=1 Tax=Olsenella uli TaxID=133926 RepID=UPI00195DCC29|nr:MarR family winged helix-turn-helix transcriptional regulator [Olsenella uli]